LFTHTPTTNVIQTPAAINTGQLIDDFALLDFSAGVLLISVIEVPSQISKMKRITRVTVD
jgi:hypothetical protein